MPAGLPSRIVPHQPWTGSRYWHEHFGNGLRIPRPESPNGSTDRGTTGGQSRSVASHRGGAAAARHLVARARGQLRTSVRELEVEEDETSDLRLSRVYWWQSVLEVPVSELLVDSNSPLSAPVLERARLVRIMKTVAAIAEKAESSSIKRLAQTLASQLVEMMPELEGVSPWHNVGQRRHAGRAGTHRRAALFGRYLAEMG